MKKEIVKKKVIYISMRSNKRANERERSREIYFRHDSCFLSSNKEQTGIPFIYLRMK